MILKVTPFLLFNVVCGTYNIVWDEEIAENQIVAEVSDITITDCYLRCDTNEKCKLIGLQNTNNGSKLCTLLTEKKANDGKVDGIRKVAATVIRKIDNDVNFDLQLKPVHGCWSEWTEGKCDVSCGTGTVKRNRTCNNPVPVRGGDNCTGPSVESKPCFMSCLVVNGSWSNWNEWEYENPCAYGANGTNRRKRTCDNPTPVGGGNDCVGLSVEIKHCLSSFMGERIIKANSLLATLPRLPKEFALRVTFMVERPCQGFNNIIHLTTINSNSVAPGGRIPAIYSLHNTAILLEQTLNGQHKSWTSNHNVNPVALMKWIPFEIIQKMDFASRYIYTAKISGKQFISHVNVKPTEFVNVLVYASDPWHTVCPGKIKDFYIYEA